CVIPPAELGELEAFSSLLDGQPQAEIGGAVCTSFEAAPGSALFNRALGLGLAEPATEATLDEIDAFFRARGLAYGIPLTPDAQPPELPDWPAATAGAASSPSTATRPLRLERSSSPAPWPGSAPAGRCRSSGAAARRECCSRRGSRPGSRPAARRW